MPSPTETITFLLRGPAGEPVDLGCTLAGHGVTELPPFRIERAPLALHTTLAVPGGSPRRVVIRPHGPVHAAIDLLGPPPGAEERAEIVRIVRFILRLDEDLGPFYALAADDPSLAWVTCGAGRLTRCQSVFEDVVKTICTTNCAWSATVRMVDALVRHLGAPAPDADPDSVDGRVFPTPAAMADASEAFYRETVRCGYRGGYLRGLARAVASGELEIEALGRATPEDLPDEELATRLLAIPGVGPYAASHIMMMLGRYSRPIFDSWTRPTYAAVSGEAGLTDREIGARFARYGRYAGLAFWLTITKRWHFGDAADTGSAVASNAGD